MYEKLNTELSRRGAAKKTKYDQLPPPPPPP